MSNGTDFKVNIIGDAKDLLKKMEEANKQAKKNFLSHTKLQARATRTRKQELAADVRVAKAQHSIQKKHVAELQSMSKRGWTEKQVWARKARREEKHQRREQKRFQREERSAMRKARISAIRNNRGVRAGVGIAGGIGGFLVGGMVSSYGKHLQVEKAKAGLIGMGSGGSINRSLKGAMGSSLGYNQAESAQHAKVMGRATGYTGPRELQQMMRATGMEAGEVGQMFGELTKAGVSFDPKSGPGGPTSEGGSTMAKMMAAGIHKGFKKARFPEFVSGMTMLVKQQGGSIAGVIDPMSSAKTLGMLSRTGIEGFKGERGAAMAGKLQNAFYKPGGGDWGQGLFQRAMGFGVKGSGESYYTARKKQQRGLTGDNLRALLGQVSTEHGTGEEGALALEKATGLSLDYSEKLLKSFENGSLSEKETNEAIKKAVPIEKQSLNAMKGIGLDIARLAKRFDSFADIGNEHKDKVEAVQDLQLELFKTLAGMVPTMVEMGKDIKAMSEVVQEWLSEKGISSKAAKQAKLLETDAHAAYAYATTPAEKAKAALKLLKSQSAQSEESLDANYGVAATAWEGVKYVATAGASARLLEEENEAIKFRKRLAQNSMKETARKAQLAGHAARFQATLPTDSIQMSDYPGMGDDMAKYRDLPDMSNPANQEAATQNYLERKYGHKPGQEYSAEILTELKRIADTQESNKSTTTNDANAPVSIN